MAAVVAGVLANGNTGGTGHRGQNGRPGVASPAMKRTATILAVLLTLGAVLGITACEPKRTISITKQPPAHPGCYEDVSVYGKWPGGMGKTVILQRTVGGKWVTYRAETGESELVAMTTSVDYEDRFYFEFMAPYSTAAVHLRVLSKDKTSVSRDFYMTPVSKSGLRCP